MTDPTNPADAVAALVAERDALLARTKAKDEHLRRFIAYFEQDKIITPAMIEAAKAEVEA